MADIAPYGLMTEHEPRDEQHGGPASYEPTTEEKKAIKLVERLFEKGKKYRQNYDEKWLDFYRMFRGRQWKDQRPSYRHSEVINLIFRTIQSQVPLQVDARPRFEFLPQEPQDQELSEILSEVAEADWISKNWSEQLLEVIYDSNFYGAGISTMEAEKKDGIYDLVYESDDVFHAFPDPDSRDFNKKMHWYVRAEPVTTSKVKKKWPEHKDHIKSDLIDFMKGSKTDIHPIKFKSPVDNKTVLDTQSHYDLLESDKTLVLTAWLSPEFCEDDYDEHEKVETDPETGEERTYFEQVAKYPKGRKIVLAGGVLVEDGPNIYDDGLIPCQRLVNYMLPREFWGVSEVEQLEGPQKSFNKLVSFALDVLTLMGNPIWKVHSASGVDPENLVNRPGLVVEWDGDPQLEPRREEGVQLQPYVLQLIDRMSQWFNDVSGSQDVTRGSQPTGVTAYKAISALQEAAQTRIRQKQRNLDMYLQSLGQMYLSRVFQFRTAPQVYRLTGKDGAQKYFKMHVEDFEKTRTTIDPLTGIERQEPTGEMGKRMIVQPYGPTGYDPDQMQKYEIQGKFDVRVSTGSNLPFAREEKEQRLMQYFDRGLIDREEVLKGSDYPNWEAVLQRMEEKEAMAAQAEAQNAAPPPA